MQISTAPAFSFYPGRGQVGHLWEKGVRKVMGRRKRDPNKLLSWEEIACQHFVANGGDRTKAYRSARPSCAKWAKATVYSKASAVFKQPRMVRRVKELQQESARKLLLDERSVLREHMRIAFSDIRRVFDAHGNLLDVQDMDQDTACAVSAVKIVSVKKVGKGESAHMVTVREIKFWSKSVALDALSKHLGLFEKATLRSREKTRKNCIPPGRDGQGRPRDGTGRALMAAAGEGKTSSGTLSATVSGDPSGWSCVITGHCRPGGG